MISRERPILSIASSTWSRDSHGLFDYESESLNKQAFKTPAACFLIRRLDEVLLETNPSLPDCTVLARIEPFGHGFRIFAADSQDEADCMWQVIRSPERDFIGIPLDPGAIIKLGRVQIAVSELTREASPDGSTVSSEDEMEEDERLCKICFCGNEEANLISPCDCSGSVRYVHLDCLQRWLTSKCQVSSSETFTSYFWKSMHCELCKKIYPFSLPVGSRNISLFNVSKTNDLTLALELLARDDHGQAVHILTTKDNAILKLGRGHESDLRISDISVSRCHAVLTVKQGKYFIRDFGSKFGTLIKLPREALITKGTTLTIQTGRSVLTFQLSGQRESSS